MSACHCSQWPALHQKKYKMLKKNLLLLFILVIIGISCQSTREPKETDDLSEKNKRQSLGSSQISAPKVSMHEACLNGDMKSVSALISQGADADAINTDGHTPLMLAAFNGHTEIVLHLLKAGVSVNTADKQLLTPLHFAASGPNPDVVKLLIEYGAEIDATDGIENFTPLMYAAAEGNLAVVNILLQFGANTLLTDDDGDTAEEFARQNNQLEIVKRIQQAP